MKDKSDKGTIGGLVSAGGVVYRIRGGVIEVVLCGRMDPLRWSLPKGTPCEGESLVQTAVRETQEETGLQVDVEEPIGNINYWFVTPMDRIRHNKTVHFYIMTVCGGNTYNHDTEFDVVEWFSAGEARSCLTFANEVKILDKALAYIVDKVGGV